MKVHVLQIRPILPAAAQDRPGHLLSMLKGKGVRDAMRRAIYCAWRSSERRAMLARSFASTNSKSRQSDRFLGHSAGGGNRVPSYGDGRGVDAGNKARYKKSVETQCREEPEKLAHMAVVSKSKSKRTRYCYGCGADVLGLSSGRVVGEMRSDLASSLDSFWRQKDEALRRSQIKNWTLCDRCQALRRGEGGKAAVDDQTAVAIFRREVSKIRRVKAVVVFVVDAINAYVVKSLREYVGGNPIVLVATRCDLLPQHVHWEKASKEIARRASFVKPARVFMTSKCDDSTIRPLADFVINSRAGRDVYVVGGANIGKSTLVDTLVNCMIEREFGNRRRRRNLSTKEDRRSDRIERRRIEAIRELRVTTSALPGTTLQNVRVPCFLNHQHALWDTPGLALAAPKQFFPIRDLDHLRQIEPEPIQPLVVRSTIRVAVRSAGDRDPLLRLVIEGGGPIDIVWNCVFRDVEVVAEDHLDSPPDEVPKPPFPEVNAPEGLDKEGRRAWHAAREQAERAQLGSANFDSKQREERRLRALAKGLVYVGTHKVPGQTAADLVIRDLGWFGMAAASAPLKLKVYALNIAVSCELTPTVGLPFDSDRSYKVIATDHDKLTWSEAHSYDGSSLVFEDDSGIFASDTEDVMDDPLAAYSGTSVGWEFLADTRWKKDRTGRQLPEGWHPCRQPQT